MLRDDYFQWMYDIVTKDRYDSDISVKELLRLLHETEFEYTMLRDKNRYFDGVALRYKFAIHNGYENNSDEIEGVLDGPCSMLEMLIALSIRMEETIMDDMELGNRTGQWFWQMIVNMGLGGQWNDNFDMDYCVSVLDRFMNRDYDPDGKGGLFHVRNIKRDMRTMEIWSQMNIYISSIL